jgi:hypothetical protein
MKVYIASPYTIGDKDKNVYRSMVVGDILMTMGFVPFMPLMTHFFNKQFSKDYETWMEYDLEWLDSCDCVLRLEGKSSGADREVEHAKSKNIPVFYSLLELIEFNKEIQSPKQENYIVGCDWVKFNDLTERIRSFIDIVYSAFEEMKDD